MREVLVFSPTPRSRPQEDVAEYEELLTVEDDGMEEVTTRRIPSTMTRRRKPMRRKPRRRRLLSRTPRRSQCPAPKHYQPLLKIFLTLKWRLDLAC